MSALPRLAVPPRSSRHPYVLVIAIVLTLLATPLITIGEAGAADTVVATDSFDRSSSNSWGTASTGGAWSVGDNSGSQFSVLNGYGQVVLAPGRSGIATLASTTSRDTAVKAAFSVADSVGSGLHYAAEVRRQSSGDAYRIRAKVSSTGAVTLAASRITNGTDTSLTSVSTSATVSANSDLLVQAQVTGTDPVVVQAKAWRSGSTEPAWQLTWSDNTSMRIVSSGSVGLWMYLSSASPTTTVRTSSLDAWSPDPGSSTPTTPTTSSDRGSVAVGSASYSVPSGAVFADSRSGNDSASGAIGSPLRTVAAAVAKTPAGGTVVLRAGTYNESVTISKSLTIQAYPREAVWFDGSVPVTSWSASGARWVTGNWTPEFNSSLGSGDAYNQFVDPSRPLANRPDQVFFDGRNLTQVASASQVVSGTFYVDYAANTITIGDNPSGHEVRASNLGQALYSIATNVTLQGFGVRRYATPYLDSGAVRLGNANSVARDLVIQDNATIGLTMRNVGNLVERVTSSRNGMMGFGATQADGLIIRNSAFTDNNLEGFKPAPVSGGIKITRSRNLTVKNNDTSRNKSTGIWFDESCVGIVVVGNVSASNTHTGIQMELSENAIVANNRTTDGNIGILIFDTGNVRVFNNAIGGNAQFGVKLAQDQRRQAVASWAGHDPRQPIPDSTNPWLTRNITIANNAFGNGGLFQIYGLDGRTNISMDQMNVTINGNLFNRRVSSSNPSLVGWGGGDNVTVTRYDSPEALAAAKNSSWRNASTATSIPIASMGSEIANAQSVAMAIPSDVASAIGVATGTKKLGPV